MMKNRAASPYLALVFALVLPALIVRPAAATIKLPQGVSAVIRKVDTQNYVAKIMAIDAWQNSVTVKLSTGETKTVKVNKNMNLADVNVGDTISVRISEATLIMRDKP